MGAAGLSFDLGPALEMAWGYEPSLENMRALIQQFAYDPNLINEDLIEIRYRASIKPGVHEAFSAMFPEPRQQRIQDLTTPEDKIAALPHQALIIHGREDRFVPVDCAIRYNQLIARSQLHIFGQCGHWAQIEHMARFHALVTQFINEPG
jgi:2-hydroxymuconate-semialdehyde hydrolase